MYSSFIKRFIDITLSSIGIIILSPVFIIVSIITKLDSKGPIIFKQKRIGKMKKEFYMYKFRSMLTTAPKDCPTHLLKDPRSTMTKWGAFIRKTSLDELPQLVNILKGDMSFIGPRPALWNQYDLIAERDKYHANDIRPGLSGLAQISGRDELEIAEKARLDGEYVQKESFGMDVFCILKTITSVIKGSGVVEGGTGSK